MPELPFLIDWQACIELPLCAHSAHQGIGWQSGIPQNGLRDEEF